MKLSELQQIIREAIKEVVNEAEISPQEKAAKDAELNAINKQIQALNAKKSDLASGRTSVVSENELDELANVAIRYQLAPDANPGNFTGKKQRIINTMLASGEPMSQIGVASDMGYDKQNPINADFRELVAAGIIVPSSGQTAPRFARQAEPEVGGGENAETDTEDGFVTGDLSDEEVDAMFAQTKRAGEEEPEVEPSAGTSGATQISDKDYEDFMKYSELETRLSKIKGDIMKLRRSKSVAGDLKDRPSTEIKRLLDLQASLKQRADDLLASSEYLQRRKAKMTGQEYIAPEPVEPEEDEENTLDEWAINQLQYRAGIKL